MAQTWHVFLETACWDWCLGLRAAVAPHPAPGLPLSAFGLVFPSWWPEVPSACLLFSAQGVGPCLGPWSHLIILGRAKYYELSFSDVLGYSRVRWGTLDGVPAIPLP